MWYGHMASWPNASLFLFMLSVVAVVGVIVWVVSQRPSSPAPTPEEVLRMRFARGEIDQQALQSGLAALCRDRPMTWSGTPE